MTGSLFMPLWTDAYLGDTRHLTTVQHGAYLLILMAMWRNGGSLPNEEKRLARIAGLPLDKWRKISAEIMEFMIVEGGAISQKRLKLELERSLGLSEKRKVAGSAGGTAKSLKMRDTHVANAVAEVGFCSDKNVASNTYSNTSLEREDSLLSAPPPATAGNIVRLVGVDEAPSGEPVAPVPPSAPKPGDKPVKPRADSRGTRIPADWTLNEDLLRMARDAGLTDHQARREADRFIDHWRSKPGKDAVKVDWAGTWRNWCRNAADRAQPRAFGPPAGTPTGRRFGEPLM